MAGARGSILLICFSFNRWFFTHLSEVVFGIDTSRFCFLVGLVSLSSSDGRFFVSNLSGSKKSSLLLAGVVRLLR